MIDSKSSNDLHPTVKRACEELILRMQKLGYPVGISSTYRDYEQQNFLYSQGRTRPGSIITNAQGGWSMHNFRLAFDIFKNIVGHAYDDMEFFRVAGIIGRELGLTWGGSWSGLVDKPHFEWTNGLSLSQLRAGAYPPNLKLQWEYKKEEEERMLNKKIKELESEITSLKNENFDLQNKLKSQEPKGIKILLNGEEKEIRAASIGDYNYVMLRPISEALGYEVDFDEKRKLPILTKKIN